METFLLQQYRCDRRKLLEFVMSAGFIKEIRTPPGALGLQDVDLDTVSADYVLECAKDGRVLDLSEAIKQYYDEFDLPITAPSQSGTSFFLVSEPESSGSPPQRVPPQAGAKLTPNPSSWSSNQPVSSVEICNSRDEYDVGSPATSVSPCQYENGASALSIGLPCLHTGLSDDDLQETAYEVLLASVDISRSTVHSEEKKTERKSKFFTRLRSKREKFIPQAVQEVGHSDILDVIRVQMEISKAVDGCIRQGLMRSSSKGLGVPQISLELLSRIFKSDFSNERSYVHWQKRQANILEELVSQSKTTTAGDTQTLRCLFVKIRNTEEWALGMAPSERAEVLMAIKRIAMKLSNMPSEFGIPDETYFWTGGYHLNVRLYEKLLCCVFDILEEGRLIEETEEIIALLKSTWSTLGITQKMHDALYGWVLFRQFIRTGEPTLLDYAIPELEKVPLSGSSDTHEGAYMNSLTCSIDFNGIARDLSLIHAILMSIWIWCDNQLRNYHLHFSKATVNFERTVTATVVVRKLIADGSGELKLLNESITGVELAPKQFIEYVRMSTQAAFKRGLHVSDAKSKAEKRHFLAVLAEEVKMIAEKESTVFNPVLCRWCPDTGFLSAKLLHQLYGERLKPFLVGISQLSEDVRCVLPSADILDAYLRQLAYSACREDVPSSPSCKKLLPYEVGEISGPLILQWVNNQHDKILEWINRACHLEDWEPLSYQQKHGASIVEVLRIIEETTDQFFGFNLPMDLIHLKSLLLGIVQGFEAYLLKVVSQLVDKSHLIPTTPVLTRYKETTMNPFIKKKCIETIPLEEEVQNQLNDLIVSKLCIRLNTLHYILNQINTLEDSIRKGWTHVRPCVTARSTKNQHLGALNEELHMRSESADELFSSFNNIRRTANDAIMKICDFVVGYTTHLMKIKAPHEFNKPRYIKDRVDDLYSLQPQHLRSVGGARLECHLEQFDIVLDNICDLIVDPIRDLVVLDIFRALSEGYVWVLLDGGPSRVFSESDIGMMQEDLAILKDFFVANGEGLPRGVVENEARVAQQILNLYALQTETIINMLMTASEQISTRLDCRRPGTESTEDVGTLLRILCHKSDREASKFLKRQYQLPKSSDYEDVPRRESAPFKGPLISDLLNRSTSFRWTEKSQRSLRTLKKKLQGATSEMKQGEW